VKRYASKFLKSLALCYMGFPFVYLFAIALLFDVPPSQCMRVLLAPSFYLLSFFVIVTGYGLWEVKRWAWYAFMASTIMIGYANAVVAVNYSESYHTLLAFIFSAALLLGLFLRVGRELRVPYFLPKIRWWESNPRYKLSAPAELLFSDRPTVYGEILDISLGGCFIKLRTDIAQHEIITVKLLLFGTQIVCQGTVVWCTQSTVTHPKGIGVKFSPLARPTRRTLRAMTRRLKLISSLYRSSRYLMSQEEFLRRLEELQTRKLDTA
jgi:Tfp pilus assembly protein PilZ